ncbi:DUF4062 domain-containing protein [Actinoplanes sp. NPDC049548]|uniref:DUF4062 domain-containing protein n=1 Tax=Actinoplanes sp. NPDC049548 TaxID=3155152 RepID=UPI00341843DC
MARIYVSSTFRDLQDEREGVYRALRELGHDVTAMEDYVAADERPVDKCLRDVADSDVYVGLFAWRYGYVPGDDDPAGLSITEREYLQAGVSAIPRLIFLLREDAPWPPPLMDSRTGDNGRGDRITALRERLARRHVVGLFGSVEELSRQVASAVTRHLAGHHEVPLVLDSDPPRRRFRAHMRTQNAAMSERQVHSRYVELDVLREERDRDGFQQRLTGPLAVTAPGPGLFVLAGPHGSGKTTSMLHEAAFPGHGRRPHAVRLAGGSRPRRCGHAAGAGGGAEPRPQREPAALVAPGR